MDESTFETILETLFPEYGVCLYFHRRAPLSRQDKHIHITPKHGVPASVLHQKTMELPAFKRKFDVHGVQNEYKNVTVVFSNPTWSLCIFHSIKPLPASKCNLMHKLCTIWDKYYTNMTASTCQLMQLGCDILTPLKGILGFTEMFYESTLDSEQMGYIDRMRVCTGLLLGTVNNILDLIKLQNHLTTLECESVSLMEIQVVVQRAVNVKIMERRQRLTFDVQKTARVIVNKQNCIHAIVNIVAYISQCSNFDKDIHVAVTTEHKKLCTTVTVNDIKQSVEEKMSASVLFSITKKLVSVLNGHVNLTTSIDQRTSVLMTIPLHDETYFCKELQVRRSRISKETLRVLIVEEKKHTQLNYASFLKTWNFDTFMCSSGMEALEALKSNQFDSILTNVSLPDMSGFEFARLVKLMSTRPKLVGVCNIYPRHMNTDMFETFVLQPVDELYLVDTLVRIHSNR